MNQEKLPQNGLPKELCNIPFGQIFILTNPYLGITSKNIYMMQFIFSMAKQYDQHHVVNSIPMDYSGLWDCFVCKLKTDNGAQILIADNDSLVEMLCEFWGLDYAEVSMTIKIAKRNNAVTLNGHPMRVHLIPDGKNESAIMDVDNTFILQYLPRDTKKVLLIKIRSILQDNFNQGLGISSNDILMIYEEEKNRERKNWHLDIHINKGKEGYNANYEWVQKMVCEINLIDPEGNKHPLNLEAQFIALYLSFILFKEGIKLVDLGRDDFYAIFKTICERLPRVNNIPDKKTFVKNAYGKKSKIKKAIENIIKEDKYMIEQFAIEGYEGEEHRVAGSTDEHREMIKKAFDIE